MRKMWLLVIGLLLPTLAILAAFLYSSYHGLFSPMFASAVATSALVFVTAVSVCLTLLLLSEQRQAREQEIRPHFKLEFTGFDRSNPGFNLRNIGNGPAQDVEAFLEIQPSGERFEATYPNVEKNSTVKILDVFGQQEYDAFSTIDEIIIHCEFKDIMGSEHEMDRTYNLREDDTVPHHVFRGGTIEGRLREISNAIDRIE